MNCLEDSLSASGSESAVVELIPGAYLRWRAQRAAGAPPREGLYAAGGISGTGRPTS